MVLEIEKKDLIEINKEEIRSYNAISFFFCVQNTFSIQSSNLKTFIAGKKYTIIVLHHENLILIYFL